MVATRLSGKRLERFDRKVREIEEKLRPDVVRIRYTVGEDWTGDPGIFFRVVLADEAVTEQGFGDLPNRIRDTVSKTLGLPNEEYFPYFYSGISREKTS